MIRKHPPLTVYFNMSFTSSALYSLIFTVNVLYYIFVAKLDPLQLVLVGTALEASIFIFEVPTGVLADTLSRRLSIILGIFLIGIAFLINGSWPVFWVILLAQVLWALGYTFTSGATQAWISDEVGEENAGLAFVRAARWEQWGSVAGTLLAILVALLSIRAPILIGGVLFLLLAVYLFIFMPEQNYTGKTFDPSADWREFINTFCGGLTAVRLRPALIGILAAGFIYGFYSEGYDRLWQAHLLDKFTLPDAGWFSTAYSGAEMSAVFWYALFKITLSLLASAATKILEGTLHHINIPKLVKMMIALSAILFLALLGFAVTGNLIVSLVLVLVIGVTREVIYPIYTTWVNHRLPSNVRATVLSFSSQVDAVGQTIGGPLVGVVARQFSITVGLLTSSAMLAPVLPILWGQRKKDKEHLAVD